MESIGIYSSFRLLDWDSSHFGIRIGRVLPIRVDEKLFKEALTWADLQSIDCMYVLVDSNDAATIRLASEFGWRMVDVRVTLGTELPTVAKSHPPMRPANAWDIPYLKQLAMRSHKDSRFYTDGNFRATACDELFAIWIERSVLDRDFAGAVFVPELEGNKPAGYITCAIKQGVGDIGLIAIDPDARRTGLATRLLEEAARWFSEQGAQRVSVVTHGCNIPALRMYERYGFTIESIQLWFHWWSRPGKNLWRLPGSV
jgi:dTDP-4-amino-4,6-dideoxy-D-galactose acyltransferase